MTKNIETIPDVWIMGFCTANKGATVQDAVDWWMYQKELEAQE